jgi:uncharacterized protein (DUF302 family)
MKKLILALCLTLAAFTSVQAEEMKISKAMAQAMIMESMQMWKLEDGVSMDDAVESMKLRANSLNFKLVAELPLSKQVEAMGKKARRMDIFAFCDALIAQKMVEFNKVFAGFLPCRIALIEDTDGVAWIITTNMDMMLYAVDLPPEIEKLAKTVRDNIYSIVDAGVTGDL